jgi:hypothetical protein
VSSASQNIVLEHGQRTQNFAKVFVDVVDGDLIFDRRV